MAHKESLMGSIKEKVKITRVDAPISTVPSKKANFGIHGSKADVAKVLEGRALNEASLKANGGVKLIDATDVTVKHTHASKKKAIALAIGAGVALVGVLSATFIAFRKD